MDNKARRKCSKGKEGNYMDQLKVRGEIFGRPKKKSALFSSVQEGGKEPVGRKSLVQSQTKPIQGRPFSGGEDNRRDWNGLGDNWPQLS